MSAVCSLGLQSGLVWSGLTVSLLLLQFCACFFIFSPVFHAFFLLLLYFMHCRSCLPISRLLSSLDIYIFIYMRTIIYGKQQYTYFPPHIVVICVYFALCGLFLSAFKQIYFFYCNFFCDCKLQQVQTSMTAILYAMTLHSYLKLSDYSSRYLQWLFLAIALEKIVNRIIVQLMPVCCGFASISMNGFK